MQVCFVWFPYLKEYELFFAQRHTFLEQQSVVMVIFQIIVEVLSAKLIAHLHPWGAEKCGRQALREHKLNSQAHFKGRHIERQTPDEPLKQFHIKSTDVQISTMICQVPAEFTGAGIAEFHTPARAPAPLLSAITGRRLAAEGDGKHLR